MAHSNRPENIQERTFRFGVAIVRFYVEVLQQHDASRTLGRQLLRCGTSIGANLEEAEAGQSRADFISKCSIALKEARECFYWLRIMVASGLAPQHRTSPLLSEANEIISILTTIVKKSKGA
jgi:four helix bundle protein